MKLYYLLSFVLIVKLNLYHSSIFENGCLKTIPVLKDSTTKQKMIVQILNSYDNADNYLFCEIVRCNDKKRFEIIKASSVYKNLSQYYTELSKEAFVNTAYLNINANNQIYSCLERNKIYFPNANYELVGETVKGRVLKKFKQQPIQELLKKYFQVDRMIKKEYNIYRNELIAVCYINNIKTFVSENGRIKYSPIE